MTLRKNAADVLALGDLIYLFLIEGQDILQLSWSMWAAITNTPYTGGL